MPFVINGCSPPAPNSTPTTSPKSPHRTNRSASHRPRRRFHPASYAPVPARWGGRCRDISECAFLVARDFGGLIDFRSLWIKPAVPLLDQFLRSLRDSPHARIIDRFRARCPREGEGFKASCIVISGIVSHFPHFCIFQITTTNSSFRSYLSIPAYKGCGSDSSTR